MEKSEELELDKDYWSAYYQSGNTPWDAGSITTPLKTYLEQVGKKDLAILIPGGGNGHEAAYLHNQGFTNVFLLDFAFQPLQDFTLRVPDFPPTHLLHKEFFELEGSQFDLVVEQTFFCALHKALRPLYAQKMHAILKPGGKLVGVLFSDEMEGQGPPFGGSAIEYQAYFEPYFRFIHFAPCYNSILPRQGREIFMVLERRDRP